MAAVRRRINAWIKARYKRFLISSAETDIKRLESDYESLPAVIHSYRDYAAELRVELALLEQKTAT